MLDSLEVEAPRISSPLQLGDIDQTEVESGYRPRRLRVTSLIRGGKAPDSVSTPSPL